MKFIRLLSIITATLLFVMCNANSKDTNSSMIKPEKDLSKFEVAYFAAGCFWCVEAVFESVKGVKEAVSGYSGGVEPNPTYRQVSAGRTGHTEAVKVYYDPEIISYRTLIRVYYGSHNPITEDGQHPDYGKQYRSAIFYQTEGEKLIIENYISNLEKLGLYDDPVATEVIKFQKFWKAEEYHQDYERLHPEQPYVKSVSTPRLIKFMEKHKDLLKEEALKELEK